MATIGRPRGRKSAPNPIREHLQEVSPTKIPRKRAPGEAFQGTKYISGLKLDAVTHACLELHAFRRRVPLSWLIQDVLNLWIAASTDYNQAIFKETLPLGARAARTPERFPGYIESLGFAEAPPQAPLGIPLPPATPIIPGPVDLPVPEPVYLEAPTAQPPTRERSLTDLTMPYRHPLTQGPASYESAAGCGCV